LRILFDQNTPAPLRHALQDHSVQTAHELGWSELSNGELLNAAEAGGYEVFVTAYRNLQYQQNIADRKVAIVVLSTTSWPRIRKAVPEIVANIASVAAGDFTEIDIP
jgi:glutamate racemase